MNKALLCAGEKTQSILQKFDYNVGGIDLIGCNYSTELQKAITSAGRLNKIIIFGEGIVDGFLPEAIQTEDFEVIIVLKDESLMQQFDIDYVGRNNIQIVDARNQKITYIFIQELISASKVEDYLIYKAGNLDSDDFGEDDGPTLMTTPKEEPEQPVARRNVESEDAPIQSEGPIMVGGRRNVEREVDINEPVRQERKVSIARETNTTSAPIVTKREDINEAIRKTITYYKGCVMTFFGTPTAYTSTNVYNIGKYLAKIGITTCIIDLDGMKYSQASLNDRLNETVSLVHDNSLFQALKDGDALSHSQLVDTNLKLLTGGIICNPIEWNEESVNELHTLILNAKKNFRAVLLDMQISDLHKLTNIISISNKVVFSLFDENKDYLDLMRYFETAGDDTDFRNKLFKDSCYILIDPKDMPRLGTKKKNISAIDDYLESLDVINELKYGNIRFVGNIMTDDKHHDYLEKEYKANEVEIKNTLEKILCGENKY